MLFYPIHQAIGQINGTLFMATGRNSVYMKITVTGLLVSIPFSYVLIAPGSALWGVGMGLGAMGLALKILGLNFLFVNIQSWVISRYYGIRFQWRNQIGAIVILMVIGYTCKFSVDQLHDWIQPSFSAFTRIGMLIGMVGGGLLYLGGVLMVLMLMPRLAGMTHDEVTGYLQKIRNTGRLSRE
jgi:hypothetical protein